MGVHAVIKYVDCLREDQVRCTHPFCLEAAQDQPVGHDGFGAPLYAHQIDGRGEN